MPKMRAMIVPEAGGKLRMEERELPEPSRHEVRIKVHACGVCHSDALTIQGGMPGLSYPRIPGHEVIGVIDAIGPDVEGWTVGSRVGVGWFAGSCGYCGHCRRGDSFACENIHGATGVTRDGGYATHMLALSSALARVPDSLNSVDSAPLLCAGITTFNALRNCGARPGDLVAIHGVGGSIRCLNRGRGRRRRRHRGCGDELRIHGDDPGERERASRPGALSTSTGSNPSRPCSHSRAAAGSPGSGEVSGSS
jgi:alcohol dehydrogenase